MVCGVSHNTHWDCRRHGGATFTMGKGAATSYSRKVKLNSRSSTKTELLTSVMYMPEMLWSLYFIQSQGYEPEYVGLYQDNISTQLLIKNGRFSSGKKMKHIKAKFFFIKDSVDSREIKVIDCPVEEMWADVLTKPLQGMAFRTVRAQLMNCAIYYEDEEEKTQPRLMPVRSSKLVTWKDTKPKSLQAPQECVGLNRQKYLPRPTIDRWLGIARIQNREKRAKNKVRSKQWSKEVSQWLTSNYLSSDPMSLLSIITHVFSTQNVNILSMCLGQYLLKYDVLYGIFFRLCCVVSLSCVGHNILTHVLYLANIWTTGIRVIQQ